ncbi:MAG TPA: fibronectin type III domain-containing protein [Deltaproteobacteria bacterium]|jgi:fibronectin type 3 domain-containing protein|nr:fibronectin type III domain-containing protein [Deltaproteobacteria bacterium]HPV29895.1 fibronectin type III domain-containing protein [Deltaproteobacteria bacterium]
MTKSRQRAILCIAALLISIACGFWFYLYNNGEISLEWNSNHEADLAGYKIYYGTAPRNYTNSVIVRVSQEPQAETTRYRLKGLTKNRKYYLAVTAFNQTGQESTYSNEVEGHAR